MNLKYIYFIRLIGFVIFFYLIAIIDFLQLRAIIGEIRWHYLIIAEFFWILQILIKSQRWRLINEELDIKIPLLSIIKVRTIAGLLGSVTPGRLGDLIKARFIKNYSTSQTLVWIGVILDRVFDLIVIIIFGVISLLILANFVSFKSYLTIAIILLSLLIIIILFKYFENLGLIIIKKLVSKEIFSSIISIYQEFLNKFLITFKQLLLKGVIYTGISFITQCLVILFISYSMGLQIPFLYIAILISISSLVSLLPISIGGIGTREGVYILLLNRVGISIEEALACAFMDGILISIVFQGILAFSFWSTNRFKLEF